MKFIIDAQLFQTDTWHRGMGRYSLELLRSLEKQGFFKGKQVELLINSNMPLDKNRRQLLKKLIPAATIKEMELNLTNTLNVKEVQVQNRRLLDEVYSSNDDIFFILSLFEGDAGTIFPTNTRKILLAYDLIPIFFYDNYLAHHESSRTNYFGRFNVLFEADHIFTISQTTKDDLVRQFGLPSEKLTNINGASINLSTSVKAPTYKPTKKFIISTTGDDVRKNNFRMVEAYEQYNKETNYKHELVITSVFSQKTINALSKLSKNITFVGNISEEELNWYYQNAKTLLFVPEYEGLGLPVLEAVEANCNIVCSDISVFREMDGGKIFNYCDPRDVDSIKNALKKVLQTNSKATPDRYKAIIDKFNWQKTAKLLANVCENLQSSILASKNKKLAIICPHPGGKSAISKVVEVSHYELSRQFEVDYYFEAPKEHDLAIKHSFLEYVATTRNISDLDSEMAKRYDGIFYHLGNSTYHLKTIIEALAVPGINVFHDTRYGGAFKKLLNNQMISLSRYEAENKLDEHLRVKTKTDHAVSLVNSSKKSIAHSNYARKSLQSCLINTDININKASLPIGLAGQPGQVQNHQLKIAMAGIISKAKGLNLLIELLKSNKLKHNQFILFGYDFAVDQLLLKDLSKHPNLEIKRNLNELEFRQQLNKSNILLNYREAYNGETSYATLEAMREGVVPIVRDIGWFSELPDDAVIKVSSTNEIEDKIVELENNREYLDELSRNSYKYVIENHSPAKYAQQLIEVLQASD